MTSVCSVCLAMLRQVSPINDGELSHGLCREHELAALIGTGTSIPKEVEEYAAIRSKYETLTVQVPPHVAANLRAVCAAAERHSSRHAEPALVAGVALARQLNKMEYDRYELAAYLIPKLRTTASFAVEGDVA